MRVSTAVTFVLTVLLITAMGTVVAAPSAVASTAPDQSPSETLSHSQPVQYTGEPAPSDSLTSPTVADQQQPLPAADPAQVLRIQVTDSGDTEWTIETRFLLTDDDDVDTFTEYADEVTAGNQDVGIDRSLFEREAVAAEQSTGRSMSIQGFEWDEPRIESTDEYDDEDTQIGIISQSFTWTNFAAVDGDRVLFGDAFETPTGPWLSTLTDQQRLVVQAPSGYSFDEFNTPTTSNSGELIWDGPQEFESGDLDIVFVRVVSVQNWGLLVAGGAAILLVAGAIAYLIARRQPGDDGVIPAEIATRLPGVEKTSAGRDAETAADPPTNTDGGDAELSFEEDEAVDPELLSDEERVHRLLTQNGGRMKQGSIVTETGWSNAKVSQLLSKMDDNGEIEKLRIGRENLITHPDVDPTEIE